ncbi:MAG: formylglycine-generating enzyme family protein [Candidatus Accumulibacter phosphatis]|uniref:Formylglycine-generating enzyme family protein n=5 Tax=Candidatus Accumulibacter TaxID=327159 RepID=A0A080MBL9_9PROT|nr:MULTISPECIES: formylglycine-generating enzyme family protein [Candidatus Accumulibacter]KFB78593.1 MAG: Serine/threonine-protein kinase pkn1 [Candidatus Accumulibacter cognatus]MBN8518118.1 formylglycine-generating enzyme family protein [Accumulibacter sp.]MBO3709719.1 formylglycine-generating enzyme family protein [Accumulibacter sp.]MCC2866813.1 formylglycine-generating enzyme family protein [Candidatus Accumulibacter phosphatis]MCM8580648.1 formylglycine-generating enzyme family protein 
MSEIIPPRPIPPPWVSNVVEDRFGLSVILRVGNAQQLFRWIRPGHFLMGTQADESERGSAELQHEVTLSNGYWLADTACTQAFWLAVWPVNPSHFQDHPQNPVENVSWHDAQGFIAELNRRFPGLYARLPSEAEWEYACRATTTTPFSFGNQVTVEQVNFHGHYPCIGGDKGIYRQRTVPVASLPANPWGLYEMHGNVWEWCADWYGEYPAAPQFDPSGPIIGKMRVLRGGTWSDPARYARSANRSRIEPAYRPRSSGFRVALGQIRSPVGIHNRIC